MNVVIWRKSISRGPVRTVTLWGQGVVAMKNSAWGGVYQNDWLLRTLDLKTVQTDRLCLSSLIIHLVYIINILLKNWKGPFLDPNGEDFRGGFEL